MFTSRIRLMLRVLQMPEILRTIRETGNDICGKLAEMILLDGKLLRQQGLGPGPGGWAGPTVGPEVGQLCFHETGFGVSKFENRKPRRACQASGLSSGFADCFVSDSMLQVEVDIHDRQPQSFRKAMNSCLGALSQREAVRPLCHKLPPASALQP